jgi:hypothetical protein
LFQEKIYDIPCDDTEPEPDFTTSSPKSDFQKLRENFENQNSYDTRKIGIDVPNTRKLHTNTATKTLSIDTETRKFGTEITDSKKIGINASDTKKSIEKPPLNPKPNIYVKKISKSQENIADDFRSAKRIVEKKFNVENKRYRNRTDTNSSLSKRNTQLDVDRENVSHIFRFSLY